MDVGDRVRAKGVPRAAGALDQGTIVEVLLSYSSSPLYRVLWDDGTPGSRLGKFLEPLKPPPAQRQEKHAPPRTRMQMLEFE